MSEIERVRALRDAGHITPEEAERLIGVLQELDGEAPVDAPAADRAPARAVPPAAPARAAVAPPVAPVPAPVAPRPASADPESILAAPAGTRWCAIELMAADLTVRAADVAEPVVDADEGYPLDVTPTADGVRVAARRGLGVERWIGNVHARDVRVQLPRGWGLVLDLKAGDASVRDVPFVRGRMLAGDLEVRGAEAVDLAKAAGDLEVAFRPTHGRHRITSKAGAVDVTFLPGSQATVEGSVSIGDLDARGFDVERRTVGASARGRLGDGSAQVEVRLTAGDLHLRAPRTEG